MKGFLGIAGRSIIDKYIVDANRLKINMPDFACGVSQFDQVRQFTIIIIVYYDGITKNAIEQIGLARS